MPGHGATEVCSAGGLQCGLIGCPTWLGLSDLAKAFALRVDVMITITCRMDASSKEGWADDRDQLTATSWWCSAA